MRLLRILLYIIGVLIIVYLFGPRPDAPKYSTDMPAVPAANLLDTFVATQEAHHKLKPNNQARIVWQTTATNRKQSMP